MPKTSSLLVWEPSRLRTLALRNRMNELRLSKRALVKHHSRNELLPPQGSG